MYTRSSLAQKVIPITRCTFCNKSNEHDEVEMLVASQVPGVHICQMCLGEAMRTFVVHVPGFYRKLKELLRRLEPQVPK